MKMRWLWVMTACLIPTLAAAAEIQAPQDFLKIIDSNGYKVTFHVTKAEDGISTMMVKVEKDRKAVEIDKMKSKAITSDGRALMKKMKRSAEWYAVAYDLPESGQQQLMALFKTEDKKNHFVVIWYPGMDHGQ